MFNQPAQTTTATDDGLDAGPLRILVVDDSPGQRLLLNRSLSRLGYEVVEAASGDEALEICRQQIPDLIVSDWMMPGMSGLEFCEAFRAMSQDQFAYFILLTSKSDKAEVARGLDAGADDFLTKPVDPSEMRARIKSGTRILRMQRELSEKNRMISRTLQELQRFHTVLEKDLKEAQQLQQSLVRETHKAFPQGDLSLLLRSAGHVGGDLVGFFPAGANRLGLYAIDVSGHGISSALMTARLAGYLSAAAPDQNVALCRDSEGAVFALPPDQVVENLNDLVLNEMETEHYFTLLLVILDLETGRGQIAQAGHPHPLIQRADGRIEQEGTGGFPVGLMEAVSHRSFDIQLHAGDRLLLLSDGVTECPDPKGEMLGEEGLARLVSDLRGSDALLDDLTASLAVFAGTDDFPDDVSGILFEFSGPADQCTVP